MDRRSFSKLVGLLLAALGIPKGFKEMRAGDLLAKMASDQQLSKQEIQSLRGHMARIDNAVGQMGRLVGPGGQLTTLYHGVPDGKYAAEVAQLSGGTGNAQSIPNATRTQVTFGAPGDGYLTWAHGAKYSGDPPDTIELYQQSPLKNVYQISGYINWSGNATGYRIIYIYTATGANIQIAINYPGHANGFIQPFVYTREAQASEDSFYLEVEQNSGGALDINNRFFVVARVR